MFGFLAMIVGLAFHGVWFSLDTPAAVGFVAALVLTVIVGSASRYAVARLLARGHADGDGA